jgi:integrase
MGGPLPPRRFSARYWRPAARAVGYPSVTPHQLRHLHVTQLLEKGRPLTEVAARLGHRNMRVTAERYAKWIQPDDSGAADATPDFTAAPVTEDKSSRTVDLAATDTHGQEMAKDR